MKIASIPALLVGAATLYACHQASGPNADNVDDPGLRTDQSAYALERRRTSWEADIPYEFVNRTGDTVYLTNCRGDFGLRLEKWHEGEWVTAWTPVQLMCLSPPLEIGPGATFADTVHVIAGLPGSNVMPKLEVEEVDGAYRLVWLAGSHDYNDGEPGGALIDDRFRTSNTFTLSED
jgi:hypothetical protein